MSSPTLTKRKHHRRPQPERVLPAPLRLRANFIKEHYDSVRHLPVHDRFRELHRMYNAVKNNS